VVVQKVRQIIISSMRELKFRMWDKVNNKFIDPFRFEWNDYYKTTGMVLLDLNGKVRIADYSSGNGDNSASSVYSEINNPDNYVIQQYTGLTDINGKKIYEGDIVKYKTWTGRHDGIIEENQTQVQFKDGAYYPRYINDECEDSWYSFKVYDLEVVGNVFETPHLDENE
jgi:uncharacterized phage protein (TIGR01671 family)